MALTAEERVYITSFCLAAACFLGEKMAEKVLLSLLFGGTEVVIDMGRWIEKNEATCTSNNIAVSYRASYTYGVFKAE